MDTEALRSFVRAAELGQFQHAADELGVTQQAVSKRIAALERELQVRLFTRTPRGVEPTLDGQAFLPHARSIVASVERAVTAVRPGSRALRIDVLGLRSAQAVVLHDYWRSHPEVDLDVVTLRADDPRVAVAAVEAGDVDASFRTVTDPAVLPPDVCMMHAFDSPLELLVGPGHPLASARELRPSQLRKHRIWVPGIAAGSEWAEFYDQLVTHFDLRIDAAGPHFGDEVLLDALADSSDVATLVGARDRYLWPEDHDLRRIPLVNPTLAYPLSLILPRTNPHPGLRGIITHLGNLPRPHGAVWRPSWSATP
ncbi:LysR family transcriptional regulator [Streptomyces clavifer]|uniref:DNA-binding transcriptional LysR family regulator n=1 Tax=Streptomyces clavifer TaxID=68188 RepID=A0ABS4VK63_9ACTN|nr:MULTISPECIES: LysR family transcriptional regulator [Streptomyces]KQX78395.1 LysR family transcriptional regulator [Streptomyces sp. Root1319]KQZ03162.1 LysR family transcriptional regulator [Streptomyces sp. Root55]MBP2364302.1 DNA-binding transcriptional LysR family regulator [Streptomyces clavifer]MDX2747184.1 LysR family transcriptional regulator [Streptomyces sp. NRRL_B-2557]GHB24652.1 LysR family transcriptional regulator [Streptomyces clavifer]